MTPSQQFHSSELLLPASVLSSLKTTAPRSLFSVSQAEIRPLINGVDSEIVSIWLNSEESLQLHRYTFEKRRNEWLYGRICAKKAALELLNSGAHPVALRPTDISVKNSLSGRPYIRLDEASALAEDIDISISHSHGQAIAVAGYGRCGVDIQQLNDTLYKVRDRYCTEIEAAKLDATHTDELIQLGLLWGAKEALRKSLSDISLLGFHEMELEELDSSEEYRVLSLRPGPPFDNIGTVPVTTCMLGSFVFAACTLAREHLNA